MSVRDLVCIAIGELVLAAAFALGIAVGVSLQKRKESQDDNGNQGSIQEFQGWYEWRDASRR